MCGLAVLIRALAQPQEIDTVKVGLDARRLCALCRGVLRLLRGR